ncbi:hypothetical protein F2Q68_00032135 [Brassica cretica]|uniref:Uncharacterized protein n=1 Tax=Brassica cretica TaxID=69181 RepID=A0A8S9GJV8_BRACR|nr:hypothetical protein F2Q68_00032135 [Brassica cretica]
MNFEVLERGEVSEPNRFFSSNSLFPFLYALPHNLVKSKADLERLRVERRGGHWLRRLLGLVSPCWLEVQICKKGVCGDVRSLSRHVRCSMSPPVQGNSGVPLWRHTKVRAEDGCSPYFLL